MDRLERGEIVKKRKKREKIELFGPDASLLLVGRCSGMAVVMWLSQTGFPDFSRRDREFGRRFVEAGHENTIFYRRKTRQTGIAIVLRHL